MDNLHTGLTSYLLVLAAEFGDKSQLICLVLAARHRAKPVFLGAIVALASLTGLAALLGASLTFNPWIPKEAMQFLVAGLFAFFGIHMLIHPGFDPATPTLQHSERSIFVSTLLLISLSEMGDKTQLLVIGLSAVEPSLVVFSGATLALITSSALGIWAGSRLLNSINLKWVHRAGAVLFLIFALNAAYQGVLGM